METYRKKYRENNRNKDRKNRKGGRNVRRRRTEKKVGVLIEGGQKRRQEF